MPAYFHFVILLLFAMNSCTDTQTLLPATQKTQISIASAKTVRGISLPKNFIYVQNSDTAYANWLLDLPIRQSKTVYLYNGKLKTNQDVQYCVLDIDIGKKDLVQCADAVIKLKADFLFEKHRYNDLKFISTSGDSLILEKWLKGIRWKVQGSKLIAYKINNSSSDLTGEYKKFMELVFSYCGSYSLAKQLKPVTDIDSIQAGDVFIQGGFPGHAVTIMAAAKNSSGERIFLLSQGYMPAQDIHILKNYYDPDLSPWYSVKEIYPLFTPHWQFETGSLKRW